MLSRRIASTLVSLRETLISKMILTPKTESNFYTTEVAIQVLVLEIGGRRLGFWRWNEDAESYKKHVFLEWRAAQAQRTQWYGKTAPASLGNDPWSGAAMGKTRPPGSRPVEQLGSRGLGLQ